LAFVKYHQPCPLCGSSDAASLNEDGSAYCFSCDKRVNDYENLLKCKPELTPIDDNIEEFKVHQTNSVNEIEGSFAALTDRGISLATAKKYNVKALKNNKGEIEKHFYPYCVATEVTSYKIRESGKHFTWRGNSQGTGLFGQSIFKDSGKYITLVEGECDAMAAYELLGSKWPVVSIKSGAAGAPRDVKNSIEFLEGYDNIIINFDNDKAGRDAAKQVAMLLTPGKAKILTLPDDFKDPNEMLKVGRVQSYVDAWWSAKLYTPSGVLNISEQKDNFNNRELRESVAYPWDGLNNKLYGLRRGELVTLTGGTGLGKSSVTREIEHWLITHTKDNVGIIALEEDWRRTVDGILSIEANARLYIDQVRETYSEEQLSKLFDRVYEGENKDRVWIHSHFGITDIDEIFSKLRFLIIGCECRWVVVDHLHMLVSAMVNGDERRAIDNIMTRLRSIVEETGVGLILVSHLRRVEGNRGHENGISVSLSHLRGSQSIAQLSDCVIALERDQQSDDPQEANTTHMRVLKSRYTGDVGIAAHLVYDKETGRLHETFATDDEEVLL
jgi:twinkle protein